MTQTAPSPTDSGVRPAGLAGSLKMLLLALTATACLAMGIGAGFLLQRLRSPGGTANTSVADAESDAEEELTELHPGHHDEPDHNEAAPTASSPEQTHPSPAGPSPIPPSNKMAVEAKPQPEQAMNSDLLPSGQTDKRLVTADKLLLVGNHRQALVEYSALASSDPLFQPADIRLRIALCEETLGDYKQAQADYRKLVELRPAVELHEAAILGQARLWCIAGRNELATFTLLRAVLSSASNGARTSTSQVPHELAVLLAQRAGNPQDSATSPENFFLDTHLVSPTLTVDPIQVISRLQSGALTSPSAELIPTNDISVVERFSQTPDETFMNVRAERMTALELVRRVANRTGWKVRITEDARLRLQEHTLQPDCLNTPLAIVLDAILEPFEAIWRTDESSILIMLASRSNTETINTYRLQSAQRSLRFACTYAPGHPWAAASTLELARLSALSGRNDLAVQYLTKMVEQFPRSEFQAIAWYNLGKIELQLGHMDASLNAFYRASDMLMGHPLEPLSYLYAGRIQIECDRPRDAISALTRALVLANGSTYEAMATLQLASAYLMLDHFQRANEILMEHRAAFQTAAELDQAAFLAALIRFRGTKNEQDRFQAGTSTVTAMTNLNPSKCFGGHWQLLAALAYRDFGMSQQEVAVLRECLKNPYSYPLQNRARQLLLEDAPELLSEFQPQLIPEVRRGKPARLYFQTQLKEAETRFQQGDFEVALKLSRELAEHAQIVDEDRKAALRLMGRIYQARGEHELAVQCFTGIVPKVSNPAPPSTAALPLPSQGVQ